MTDTARPELGAAQRALLAQRLRRRPSAPQRQTVPVRPHGVPVPLSYAQERLWFLEQYQPGTTTYTVPVVVRVAGPLDATAVSARLTALTARYEALRSRFATTDDGRPDLVIGSGQADFALDTADSLDSAMAAVEADLERPFDLECGPLVRVRLIRLGPTDHVLLLAAHHTVIDGWSADLVLQALLDPSRTAEAPPIDYGDYALWQRSRDDEQDVAYWRRQLADLPALDLPTDRPRPSEQRHDGASVTVSVDTQLTTALHRLARQHGATLYMTLLAAYELLLSRYSGQSDFGVASPVAGRGAPELDRVIGMFVNTVVVRADLTGQPTFGGLVDRVRETTLDAFAHAELPFDRLVTELAVVRDVSRSPVAQTTFALQNFTGGPAGLTHTDVGLTYLTPRTRTARYELGLYLFETGEGLVGQLVYNTALFVEESMCRFADRFVALLRSAVADPTAPVTVLSVLSDVEHDEALALARGPALSTPPTGLLHDVVAAQAALVPSATAVVDADRSVSYAELDRLATGIAETLRAHGAAPDSPVALLLDSSTGLAAAVVGVLRSGSPYLPLDPQQPAERLAFMLADAEVRLVLTTADRRTDVPVAAREVVEVADTGLVLVRTGPPAPPVSVAATPDHLAYVIYTSGTTGRPKGVAVAHRQAMTYVAGIADRLDPDPGSRFTLLQSLSFDFGLTVFFLALRTGGTLRLADPRAPVEQLAPLLASSDYVKITPSHLDSLLLAVPPAELLPRKMLVLGGEATSWARAAELARHTTVVNHYGPTEATVGVCTYQVDADAAPRALTLPIGSPLPAACVYLLDEQLRPTPPGMVGEIYLGGDRLARGYLRRPDLTAAAFLPDPYAERPGSRMYRTGDLGRRLPGGELLFMGRRDLQVKIRGYRVELAEVEATLSRLSGVRQAVVELRSERLVAYLVGDARPMARLRTVLTELLPEYMIPTRVVWLDALPLKAHGKVDRARLPEPDDRVETDAEFVAPVGDTEVRTAAVWADVLGLDRVGVDDDFFALGGHSLLAAQVVARLRRDAPPDATSVTLLDLFTHRTVRALAAASSGSAAPGPARLLHRLTPARPVTRSVVCLPYGGGSAVIYQPLADALPADTALWSVAVPGHEIGERSRSTEDVVVDCVQEVLDRVPGPVVLYGHCGLGVMLTIEIARGLQAAGRPVEAVYLGGIFPFARPRGPVGRLAQLADALHSDQMRVNALRASGMDTDGIDPEQLRLIVANRRRGTQEAERYFGRLATADLEPLTAPVISVVGERDPATEFYQERFREWQLVSPRVIGVVLEEAGHFYLKYRAAELAEILTIHREGTADRRARTETSSWWRQDAPSRPETADPGGAGGPPTGPEPSMRRFGVVATAQLVSIMGSALTEFAVPIWIYTTTGSLVSFALLAVIALLPGMLVAPLAGVLIDRHDRRRVMLWGGVAAGAVQLAFGVLLWTGGLQLGAVFALLALLSVALTFQRLAYQSSIAQLVPKRFLGHANGIVQMTTGAGQLVVPLVAVGLIATIGIDGILIIDVVSYVVATIAVALVRFPATMAWRRRESMLAELRGGWNYTWGNPAFRAMLSYFAVLNLFLSPLFLMLTPLVLDFATLADVGQVAFAGGLGVLVGGLVMAVWGGPRRRRMMGLLFSTFVLGVCCLMTGLWSDLWSVTIGSFGMSMSLTVLNGIYATIIQVKVPQRFHGRVISLNTLVAWSTLPIGFGLIAPYGTELLGGRIGLLYVVCAAGIIAVVGVALRIPGLRRFDTEIPDAIPDDLVGLEVVRDRLTIETRPSRR